MSEIDLLIEELEDIENNPIKPFVAIRIGGYLRNYKYHEYRIAELEAAQRWIPVSERLPEDGETVFVIIHDGFERFEEGNEVARLTYLGDGKWWSWESMRYVVTHWMPLPELPEVQE